MSRGDSGRFGAIRRRVTAGPFDVQTASRALSDIEEADLTGWVAVSDGLVDQAFLFTRGALRVIAAGRALPTLRSRLLEEGRLTEAEAQRVERVLRGETRDPLPPGINRGSERDLIVHLAAGARTDDVDRAARQVLSEVFVDALFWDAPRIETATGEPPGDLLRRQGVASLSMTVGTRELLAEIRARMRGTVDLRRVLPDMQASIELTDAGKAAAQTPPADRGLAALLTRLAQTPQAYAEQLTTELQVGELRLATWLQQLSAAGQVQLTRQARSKPDQLQRIERARAGVGGGICPALRQQRLAADYASVGEPRRAARHLARAGWCLLQEERAEEALAQFREALKQAPDDVEAREGHVQSLWSCRREQEAAVDTLELSRIYMRLGLYARARRALERALSHQETSDLLDALVVTLVRDGKQKRASEVGERLVAQLKREGRAADAQAAATRLLALADAGAQKRILRAAGPDRRKALALLSLGGLLLLGFVPVRAEEGARRRYLELAREVQSQLNGSYELTQLPQTLSGLSAQLEPLAEGEGQTARRAGELLGELRDLQDDCLRAGELLSLLPWEAQPDLSALLPQLRATEARSAAFRGPLERLRQRVDAFVARGEEQANWLSRMQACDEAMRLAASLRSDYAALPALLQRAAVSVQVVTEPPGASVVYHGTSYSSKTPLEVRVPLLGARELRLTLDGYEPVERVLSFDELGGAWQMSIPLTRDAAAPEEPTTTVTGRPRIDIAPTRRPPSGTTKPPRRQPAGPQVELKDGYAVGERDARYRYEAEANFFSGPRELKPPARFRVQVRLLNRLERSNVYLVGADVVLFVRRSSGWVKEQSVRVELDDPLQRPVVAEADGGRRVLPLTRTLHIDQDRFFGQVRDALQEAIDAVLAKEKESR